MEPGPYRHGSDVHSLHSDGSFQNLKVSDDPFIVQTSMENLQASVTAGSHRGTRSDSYLESSLSSAKKPGQPRKKRAEAKNYLLLNKKKQRGKTYVERFREGLGEQPVEVEVEEGGSVSAECGDSARVSVGDAASDDGGLYDTECYNELFYEQLLARERHLSAQDLSVHEELQMDLVGSARTGSGGGGARRSASRRRSCEALRRASAGDAPRAAPRAPPPACPLGGLGPDMETLRPRLDRARSIKRYSERVRIENRHKIKFQISQNTVTAQAAASGPERHTAKGKDAGEPHGSLPAARKHNLRKNNAPKAMATLEDGGSTRQEPTSKSQPDDSIARQLFSKLRHEKSNKTQPDVLNSKFLSQNKKARGDILNREETGSKRLDANVEFASWRRCRDASVAAPTSLEALEERHRMYRAAVSGVKPCAPSPAAHSRRPAH